MARGRNKPPKIKGRKDHYLPQGYVRGFINPSRAHLPKPLWCFDIKERVWEPVSSSEIGYEIGFYDHAGPGTPKQTADQVFAEMERTFPLIRAELTATNFQDWFKHREFLLRFFQMMRARSPLFFEQQFEKSRNTLTYKVVSICEETKTTELTPVSLPSTYYQNKALDDMFSEIQKGVDWLEGFDWALRYCTDPEDPFVCPDTPCVVEGSYAKLDASALDRVDTRIYFPLCWQACLVGARGRFEVTTDVFASGDLNTMRRKHRDFSEHFIISPTRFEDWQE